MKKSIYLVFLLSSISFSQTITKVESFTNEWPINNLFFALPKTVVTAEIEVNGKKSTAPIEEIELDQIFVSDFEEMLPLKLNNITSYKIEKVTTKIKTEVDKQNIYKITTDRKFNKKNNIGINVSSSGLITGASVETKDLTIKFITSVVAVVAAFVNNIEDKPYNPDVHGPQIFEMAKSSSFVNDISNDLGKKMKEIISEKEKVIAAREGYQSKLDNTIKEVINNNYSRASSESSRFKISILKEKLKEMLVKEKKLEQNFIKELNKIMGTEESISITETIELPWTFPSKDGNYATLIKQVKNNTSTQDLMIVDYESPDDFNKCTNCIKFKLEKESISIGDFISNKAIDGTNTGLPFKIPESYKLTINSNKKKLGELSFKAAGKLGRLNPRINISNIEYYEQLGWIKSFKASNKNIETSDLDSLGSGISSFIDKSKGQTDLEVLTEETSLLELQLKKLQYQAQLDSISSAKN